MIKIVGCRKSLIWYNNLDEMKLLGYSCLSKAYSMNYEKALAERDSMKVEEQSTLEEWEKIEYDYQSCRGQTQE